MIPTAQPAAKPESSLSIRAALIAIAAIETLEAVSSIPNIFHDYGHTTALLIFAQRVTSVQLALAPLIAGTALVLAGLGLVRHAIAALAVLMLVTYVTDLPSIAIHGLEVSADFGGLTILAYRVFYPLIAIAALVLARRNERLVLATVLVSLPTAFNWLGVLAFGIGVAIYGF